MIQFFQLDIPEKAQRFVQGAMQTGMIGPSELNIEFAEALKKYFNCHGVVLTVSGTIALQVAAHVKNINKIGIPAYGTPQVANAFASIGTRLKPLDVNYNGCINFNDLINKMHDINGLCYVEFNGYVSSELKQIKNLCESNAITMIEDASCGFGNHRADEVNTLAGMTGDIGVISFSPHKMITTGQGGAIICHSDDDYELAHQLCYNGMNPEGTNMGIGSNLRMSDLNAAMGIGMLNDLDELKAKRIDQMNWFYDYGVPIHNQYGSNTMMHNIIFVRDANEVISTFRDYDIKACKNYSPLNYFPAYKNIDIDDCNGAQWWMDHAVYLPFGSGLTKDQIVKISEVFRNIHSKDLI